MEQPIIYQIDDLEKFLDHQLSDLPYVASPSRRERQLELLNAATSDFRPQLYLDESFAFPIGLRQKLETLSGLSEDTLAKWYSNRWQKLIINCHEFAQRKATEVRNFWFTPYSTFISDLLHAKPRKTLFFRHGKFDSIKDLYYRDKIIQPTGVYHLGWLLLRDNDKQGYTRLWEIIKNNRQLVSILSGKQLGQNLAISEPDDANSIIDTAWNIIARCHDLSQLEEWASIPPSPNHGIKAETILHTEYNHHQEQLTSNIKIAVGLALKAIQDHCTFLRSIERQRDLTKMRAQLIKEWQENPLGAFLSLVLVIHDLALRICWFPTNPKKHPTERPEDILLVNEIRLYTKPSLKLEFIGHENQFYRILGARLTDWPPSMNKRVSQWLAKSLGPECFGMVAEEVDEVELEWRLVPDFTTKDDSIVGVQVRPVDASESFTDQIRQRLQELQDDISEWHNNEEVRIRQFPSPPDMHSSVRIAQVKKSIKSLNDRLQYFQNSLKEIEAKISTSPITEADFQKFMNQIDVLRKEFDDAQYV